MNNAIASRPVSVAQRALPDAASITPRPAALARLTAAVLSVVIVTTGLWVPAAGAQTNPVDELPPAVVEELQEQAPEVLRQLQDGTIDRIPDNVVERLPTTVVDQIPASLLTGRNVVLLGVLAVIALVSMMGFFYGVMRSAMKAALFFAVLGGLAAAFFLVEI